MSLFSHQQLMLGLALAGLADLSQAAGFALVEQNASGLGNAYAGQAASAQDASTIFFNPAGMTLLPDRQLVLSGHLIKPRFKFSGSVSPALGGGDGGDAGDLTLVPNAYFAYRLTPDVHVGIGVNAPFGLKTDYDNTWMGRTQAIKSEVKTINLNPSIAWKASESLSLGAGLNIQYMEAMLTSATGAGVPPPVGEVKGHDYGLGFNLGALWQLSDATRVGLAYRSEIDYTLKGSFKVNGVTAVNPVYADLTLPDSASLSVFHKLDTRWDLLADVTWTGWSDFDALRIVNASGGPVSTTIENWDDSYRYSLGANYHLNERVTLRGGVAYDQTPVSDTYRTARIPDGDRTWITFGGQYRMSDRNILDFGYAHLFIRDARIDKTESPVRLSGTYEGAVDILSAQFTHNF